MSSEPPTAQEVPAPDYLVPGLRCALEMALVGMIVMLIGLPAEDPFVVGGVLLTAMVAMVLVLFWALNQHLKKWIHYAQGRPTMTDGSGLE